MKTILSRFDTNYFFGIPPESQIIWFWLGFFTLTLLASLVIYIFYRSKGVAVKPYRKYAKNFFWPNLTFSIVGLLLVFFRYEKLAMLSWRFWVYVIVLSMIVFNAWYFMIKRNQLEDDLVKYYNTKRKDKWLKNNKK